MNTSSLKTTLWRSVCVVAVVLGLSAALAAPAAAVDVLQESCSGGNGGASAVCSGGGDDLEGIFGSITNLLIFLVGAAAVIAIVIGGIRYVASNGDASQAQSAKNTILYAVVGLILAIGAYGIVNFVLSEL